MYLPETSETGEWVMSGFERALQRRVLEGRRKKLQIRAADESCGRKICAVNQRAQTVKVNVKVKQGCTSCPGSPGGSTYTHVTITRLDVKVKEREGEGQEST